MFMKYLVLVSKFNGTHVVTVGLFNKHDKGVRRS